MMNGFLATASCALAVGAPYPDVLDVLKTAGAKPRVNLLLDSSGSMAAGRRATSCSWFASTHNGGSALLSKNEQMRAVLVGCRQATDGVLDKWASSVELAIHDFQSLRAPFGSDLSTLEAAVLGVGALGATPLAATLDRGGEYLDQSSSAATSPSCQSFLQVLLSDGDPNGPAATFDQDCSTPVESRVVAADEPWSGADYLHAHPDLLCSVPGDQSIRTHTVGFGRTDEFNPQNLQSIASAGGGEYFYASSVPELIAAFDAVLGGVTARSQPLAQISLGQDGFFSDNLAFTTSFEPVGTGVWQGNLRSHCVLPDRTGSGLYDTGSTSCLFRSPDGTTLETNPGLVDLWTGLPATGTSLGGAGELLRAAIGPTVPSPPYWTKRNIVTWRAGTPGWVPVRPDTWSDADAHANGCERFALINLLHGYTQEADCAAAGAPLALRAWPLADAVHAPPLVLRYGACTDAAGLAIVGACYVLLATNGGVLHVFDAATGVEVSGLVPAELWRPTGSARHRLADVGDQPSAAHTHRYYLDGGLQLVHVDADADGLIDPDEDARVLFSMGRGGRALYALDVSKMSDGVVDADVPIVPLLPTPGTVYADLADGWAAPLVGPLAWAGGTKLVAVITTGHEPQFDIVERTPAAEPSLFFDDVGSAGERRIADCAGPGGLAEQNGYGPSGLCDDFHVPGCAGSPTQPCYDAGGLPIDLSTPPLTFDDGIREPWALRFHFSHMALGPNDLLRLETDQGVLVGTYGGQDLDGAWSDWVYGPRAVLRLVTDGVDSAHAGFRIDRVEWEVGVPRSYLEPSSRPEPTLGVDHRPAVIAVDLEAWRAATPFAAVSSDATAVLKVARDCGSFAGTCIDRGTSPDLEHLVCPISAQPTPYVVDGRIAALYFGDECGQLFKVHTTDAGVSWSASRLARLNDGPLAVSKDHRKVFRRLDVVESRCPGRAVVGLYFGTGNEQRPLATDELELPSATDGRDLVGVLWDHASLPADVGADDFVDATSVDEIDPRSALAQGKAGWLLRLADDERMLRDPLVYDGTAFFRTFQPTAQPSACAAGAGIDRVYAVDSCTAAAVGPVAGAAGRVAFAVAGDPGADLAFVAPRDAAPFVAHASSSGGAVPARLGRPESAERRPGIYLWRDVP